MIRIINGPIERLVNEEDLKKWKQAGYQPADSLPDLPEVTDISDPDPEPEAEKEEIEFPDDLTQMKMAELKALAEKVGVQGYQNMDKSTLIAVIKAH